MTAEIVSDDFGRVLNVCPMIDTQLFSTCHIAIYYYFIEIVNEEPVRGEFTRTGSSFHGFGSSACAGGGIWAAGPPRRAEELGSAMDCLRRGLDASSYGRVTHLPK
jgi:hypothetical protein